MLTFSDGVLVNLMTKMTTISEKKRSNRMGREKSRSDKDVTSSSQIGKCLGVVFIAALIFGINAGVTGM